MVLSDPVPVFFYPDPVFLDPDLVFFGSGSSFFIRIQFFFGFGSSFFIRIQFFYPDPVFFYPDPVFLDPDRSRIRFLSDPHPWSDQFFNQITHNHQHPSINKLFIDEIKDVCFFCLLWYFVILYMCTTFYTYIIYKKKLNSCLYIYIYIYQIHG